MHELSIALDIIEISEAGARAQNSQRIRTIKLRLGVFTAVVSEALLFSFEIARRGTLAQDATLEIESVPVVARCNDCRQTAETSGEISMLCANCGQPLEIVSGDEMRIEYIEVD